MWYLVNSRGLLVKLRCGGFLHKHAFLIFPLLDPLIHNLFHRFVNQFLHFAGVKREDILGILKEMSFGLSCCLARFFPHPSVFRPRASELGHDSLHIDHIQGDSLVIRDTIRVSACTVLMDRLNFIVLDATSKRFLGNGWSGLVVA